MDSHLDIPAIGGTDDPLKGTAIVAAFFTSISGWLVGYDIGIISGAIHPLESHFDLNHRQLETFAGLQGITAAVLGVGFGSLFSDRIGRKRTILLYSSVFIFGHCFMALGWCFTVLLIGRACTGVGLGMALVVEPVYTAEIAPARLRGMLTTNIEFNYNIGLVLAYVASWAFSSLPDDISWRWMFGIALIGPTLSILGVTFIIPESPRWLATKGRMTEAKAALDWLVSKQEADAAFNAFAQHSITPPKTTWLAMITSARIRWSLFLGCSIGFFGQACGIDPILVYSSVFLKEAGMSRNGMLTFMVILALVKLAFIFISGLFVDNRGRRPLLMISSSLMCMSTFIIGMAFKFSWQVNIKLGALLSFVIAFSLGYGPITYTVNGELYPKQCRTKGMAMAMLVTRGTAAVAVSTFLSLKHCIHTSGAFFVFAIAGLVATCFVQLLLPETKGTRLEDQDALCQHEDGIELDATCSKKSLDGTEVYPTQDEQLDS